MVHSGIYRKMLIALFKLVWIIQKTTWKNLFEYQGEVFLNNEKVLVMISEEQS